MAKLTARRASALSNGGMEEFSETNQVVLSPTCHWAGYWVLMSEILGG
jgi:hypothetical protein